tara:strand:- start:1495 stop:2013 length:519 start_codon:yes stop_codon:yes gene_type:complete
MISREQFYRWIDEVIDQRIMFGENEELDIPEISEMDAEQLAFLRDTIDSMRSDLSLLKSYVDQRIRGRLTGKAFRFADRVYRGRNGSKLVPYDKEKILDFLGDDWRAAVRPEFRTTAIKAIAKERGLNPNVIMESLFERVETESLDVVPLNKAPKFLQEKLKNDSDVVELGD